MKEIIVALCLALAGGLITAGATQVYRPAGLIVAGVCVVAWTVAVFAEVGE